MCLYHAHTLISDKAVERLYAGCGKLLVSHGHPVLKVFEAVLVGDVVHKENGLNVAVGKIDNYHLIEERNVRERCEN